MNPVAAGVTWLQEKSMWSRSDLRVRIVPVLFAKVVAGWVSSISHPAPFPISNTQMESPMLPSGFRALGGACQALEQKFDNKMMLYTMREEFLQRNSVLVP